MMDQITTEVVFGDMDINEKESEVDLKLKEILSLISKGENSQVEFKESLTVPINDQSKISEKIENLNQKLSTNEIEELQLDLKDKMNAETIRKILDDNKSMTLSVKIDHIDNNSSVFHMV